MKGTDEISLYEGETSGLQFFYPDCVTGSDRLYEKLQKFEWFYMPDRWEHKVALTHLRDSLKVLEVGSAKGDFVRAALNAGVNIRGIEINNAAIEVAKKEKLPVDCIDLKTLVASEQEGFDAICIFQVLEHLPEPGKFLELLLQLLKPGGMLLIAVPNADSFLQYQYNLLDIPPHHMTRWRVETFKMLEKYFPIKLDTVQTEPLASYHVKGFLSAYGGYFEKKKKVLRFALNHSTRPFFTKILFSSCLLRRFFTGQALFVKLIKI